MDDLCSLLSQRDAPAWLDDTPRALIPNVIFMANFAASKRFKGPAAGASSEHKKSLHDRELLAAKILSYKKIEISGNYLVTFAKILSKTACNLIKTNKLLLDRIAFVSACGASDGVACVFYELLRLIHLIALTTRRNLSKFRNKIFFEEMGKNQGACQLILALYFYYIYNDTIFLCLY